jgi:hypothetical protein
MSRSIRFSIAGLMGAVVVAAIGLAALRDPSETWAGIILLLTTGALALAVVGVFCSADAQRAWWLGFALFGLAYSGLACWSWRDYRSPPLPTLLWLGALRAKLDMTLPDMSAMGGMGGGFHNVGEFALPNQMGGSGGATVPVATGESFALVGHCLWGILFGTLGGTLAAVLFPGPALASPTRDPAADSTHRRTWSRWRRPASVAVAGLVILAVLSSVRSKPVPGLWAGATFLLTCGLLGLTALGAVLDRRKRGEIWLGATLFGVGYMILAFGHDTVPYPIRLPTDQFVLALKPWIPRAAEGFFFSSESVAAANTRVLQALERTVPMHFPGETALEDVLKHIESRPNGPDGRGIPIYVDPIGMQECERSLQSTVVSLDFDGIALKTTLGLCLKQLGLAFCVRDGVLVISSAESDAIRPPVEEDPFLISAHCLLTVFAAAIGGLLAPLVSDSPRDPESSPGST